METASSPCQVLKTRYPRRTMYTIKEAAARTGVPIALLRAWERRYGVVAPTRTAAGYRLYDEDALDRLRTMRALVADGWQPSAAAAAIVAGTAPRRPDTVDAPAPSSSAAAVDAGPAARLAAAAASLDAGELEAALDDIFAAGSFEVVADRLVLPALVAVGDAWADGRVTVAGEHAASQAVHRRLAAAFQAAGRSPGGRGAVLVGLPPGSRHELGALAFAVAARRAGLPVLYLGPDLPVADWISTAERTRARAVVIGTPTAVDVDAAVDVATGLQAAVPNLVVAVGGRACRTVAERAPGTVVALPEGVAGSVEALRAALARRRAPSA